MCSSDIEAAFGARSVVWRPWRKESACRAPSVPGVYVFRAADGNNLVRVKGSSAVVYVGSGNIYDRLLAHANPNPNDFDDVAWRLALVHKVRPLEVAWIPFPAEAAKKEAWILIGYFVDHFELPPTNRTLPRCQVDDFDKLRVRVNAAPRRDQEALGEYLQRLIDERSKLQKAVQGEE